jgi:DNA ligase-1
VLVYAEPGHGRRSNLLTDYTFAVWHEGALVPVAKAYSGLVQQEIESLDRWIRRHTTDRFGPVRQVEPAQVFELACDGVQRSQRHKAGLTLRFPRIARWRQDLSPDAADRLTDVEALVDE